MPGRLEEEALPRRDFLGLAGLWAAAVAVVGSIAGMMRLPMPSVLPEGGHRFRVGRPEELPAGTEQVLPEQKVLLSSTPEGIAAISLVCTHLGCIVARTENGFACPCHGSVFANDGRVIGGPAPSGLKWLEVSQAIDGRLVVNGGRQVESGSYFKV